METINLLRKIKFQRLSKTEKILSRIFTSYVIVPYEYNVDRVFYKVDGVVKFEYNIHEKQIYFDSKLYGKLIDERGDDLIRKIEHIRIIVKKYMNIDVTYIGHRYYINYKLWRDLSNKIIK